MGCVVIGLLGGGGGREGWLCGVVGRGGGWGSSRREGEIIRIKYCLFCGGLRFCLHTKFGEKNGKEETVRPKWKEPRCTTHGRKRGRGRTIKMKKLNKSQWVRKRSKVTGGRNWGEKWGGHRKPSRRRTIRGVGVEREGQG